jgi:fatty-acyl-CoA synthase
MMDYPLTVRTIYQRALTLFPDKPLVTRLPEGVRRTTYGEWAERVARLAGGLRDLGVGRGDRVATFCWNHDRHLEAYFAAALMGASYHTLNIRLGGDQLAYIVNHARDKVLICDAELAPAIGPVLGDLDTVQHLLVPTGRSWTSSRRPASATPRPPPATPRALPTPTGRCTCTR